MSRTLKTILVHRQESKVHGVFSLCTAHPTVLEACLERLRHVSFPVVIEATANQVNQYGGYTGLTPDAYKAYVETIAHQVGFPMERLVLGGDHLGPLTWTSLDETNAMAKAKELVRQYVLAGFTKIHLDTSMRIAGDPSEGVLSTWTIARRGIELMAVAEAAYRQRGQTVVDAEAPVYIIGSEVPIPGGAQTDDEGLTVTSPHDFQATVSTYRDVMREHGLESVWERVIAVVVQPGVEFGDTTIHPYHPESARSLVDTLIESRPIVFEGHSTDYQTPSALKAMVDDGIAILKVGPALTNAYREGLFALSHIEEALIADPSHRSSFRKVLDQVMVNEPKDWIKHYHGTPDQQAFKRAFSFSDRSRYYLGHPEVIKAIDTLMSNTATIPLSLLSQYMPIQYKKVNDNRLNPDPLSLVKDWVSLVVDDYVYAIQDE